MREAAIARAIEAAKRYFRETYEYYEVWESYPTEVIIRAWDTEGDYEFFTERIT